MPPTPEPPAHITIKVKVPPGYLSTTDNSSGTDSFVLGSEIPVISSVGTLRQQIQQLIPTHPAPERQRLLYGGRALVDNEQRLADAFNVKRDPSQTEYVLHLLVKGEQGASDGGPTHRRAVSTPPNQTPGSQPQPQMPFQQAPRAPFPIPGAQFLPHQQPFPQIIARNQQMRAGMGMQGVGGQPAQGQQQAGGHMDQNTGAAQMGQPGQNEAPGPNGQPGAQMGNNGQPQQGQQHPHAPGRPVSGQGFHMQGVGPNGQRFQVHHQMMQFPFTGGMPGQMPPGFPAMPQIPGMMPGMIPGFPAHGFGPGQGVPQQNNGPSALDRARENMVEMRRVLEEMRNQNGTSEEQQRRIGEIQQRAQSLNEYIDPLQLGNNNDGTNAQRSTPANANAPSMNRPNLPPPFAQGLPPPPLYNAARRPMVPMPTPAHHHVQRPSNPQEVTAYLLSSPQGPQALLFSPQHGAYTGSVAQNSRPQPTPTSTASQQYPIQHGQHQPAQQQQPPDPVAEAAHRAAQELQVQHAQLHAAQANQQAQAGQDPLGPMQALMGHFWLFFRIAIFAWFFMGSNMGWQRPLLLLALGFGFWMMRAGALGDGAAVRRWWEGVVGVEPARRPQGEGVQGQGEGQEGAQQPADGQQRNAMPTPEQVAQRLLNEQADRNQQQNAWWRERIRPVERAVALFVASLWPGVGEATVRARREMEERQRAEEEVERRRREEEEEAQRAETEKEKEADASAEGGSTESKGEKADIGESSAVEGSTGEGSEGLRERQSTQTETEGQAPPASS